MTKHNPIVTVAERNQPSEVEGTAVIILERDGSLSYHPPRRGRRQKAYTALTAATPDELPPASLIERIVSIAFDLIGANRLEVRVDES